jgi:hypothetical protein
MLKARMLLEGLKVERALRKMRDTAPETLKAESPNPSEGVLGRMQRQGEA